MRISTALATVSIVLLAIATTGCSTGSKTTGAGGPGTSSPARDSMPASSPAANGSTANATPTPADIGSTVSAASQGEPLAPIGCGAIPITQANALISTPITTVDYSPTSGGYYPDHHFTCDAGMQIQVFPQDSTKSDYTSDLADENSTPTPIPGIADTAVFTQSGLIVQGAGPMPDIYVHKGAATCEIQPSSTVSDYKIPLTSNGLSQGVSTPAAAAWAAEAAGLCTDIFTGIKA
jgi:hypothetical protein